MPAEHILAWYTDYVPNVNLEIPVQCEVCWPGRAGSLKINAERRRSSRGRNRRPSRPASSVGGEDGAVTDAVLSTMEAWMRREPF